MSHTQTIAITDRGDETVQYTAPSNKTPRDILGGTKADQTSVRGVRERGERDGGGEDFNAAAKVVFGETGGKGGVREKTFGLEC